ncbi:unnamed protein product [Penicillium pancosmium]
MTIAPETGISRDAESGDKNAPVFCLILNLRNNRFNRKLGGDCNVEFEGWLRNETRRAVENRGKSALRLAVAVPPPGRKPKRTARLWRGLSYHVIYCQSSMVEAAFFLDSVLSSLGPATRPPQSPLSQPPAPSAPSSISKKEDRNSPNLPRPAPPRPAPPRPAPSNEATGGNANGGTKRKAEDQLPRPSRPSVQPPAKSPAVRPVISSGTAKAAPPVPKSASAPSLKAKTASPNPDSKNGTLGSSRPVPKKPAPPRAAPAKVVPAKAVATTPAAPAKAPPKGSYAALMEAAKAAQGKAPTQVGVIRNQAAPKERLSKVERKRRLLEAQEKEKAERRAKRFEPSSTAKGKVASKKVESDAPSYKGTAKPSRTPEPVSYRGTANLPTNRTSNDRRSHGKRRMDEYLGTDEEEEEGDYGAGDYDDYYSDSSEDMEAGFDDVNLEEKTALKIAQRDDEDELRMETLAKKAKLERQQKLAALASRTKR